MTSRPPRHSASRPHSDSRSRRKSLPPAEHLVFPELPELRGQSALVLLVSGTAIASEIVQRLPNWTVTFWTPEHFFFSALTNRLKDHRSAGHLPGTIHAEASPESGKYLWTNGHSTVRCSADPPEESCDAVILPTASGGSSELTQELLQAAWQRLSDNGRLLATTDNARDHWLHQQLQGYNKKITARREAEGCLYRLNKRQPLRKLRKFVGDTAFRFGDRLVRLSTRPGVFNHRAVDGGARALIKSLVTDLESGELLPQTPPDVQPKIAELGCGSGAMSLACAAACPQAHVLAIDSHARAVECTQQNARQNELSNVSVLLSSDAEIPDPGTWDLVVANPPYFSDFRISELFLKAAKKALRAGGAIRIVTKLTDVHRNRMSELFNEVRVRRFGHYDVIDAIRR